MILKNLFNISYHDTLISYNIDVYCPTLVLKYLGEEIFLAYMCIP